MIHLLVPNKFPIAGGVGEKSLRSIIEMAEKVAEGSLPMDAEHLRRIAGLILQRS
jgi:hypothetical protein